MLRIASSMTVPISGVMGGFRYHAPSRALGDEENIFRRVFVLVFLETVSLVDKFLIFALETV